MKDYQKRVVEEKRELEEKMEKLASFLGSEKSESVSDEEKELLGRQYAAMHIYASLLGERITLF